MELFDTIKNICEGAKVASRSLALLSGEKRNALLIKIADNLREGASKIIEANALDLSSAKANGISDAMLDRLMLNEARIDGIADAIVKIASLDDPIGAGEIFTRPNGLEIHKMCVPLGVVAMIYEARPNVTPDASSLCLKSGNAVVLRGGKEAINSNKAIVAIIRSTLLECGIDENAVSLIEDTTRESANVLMSMRGYIDVLIPRGGKGLIKSVVERANVPVIETGAGNCHLFVDESADIDMAIKVALNAKCSRPSVCNAIETILLHESIADKFLTRFYDETRKYALDIRGCDRCKEIIPEISSATDEDYATEYDDYIVSVKVVCDVIEAVAHINKYTTGHSEAIITESARNADYFVNSIDSCALYVNASTRFTDGGEFGFGAEIGISTQKLHVRGPMGLSALTTSKYIIKGDGQVR
ncbi:MAG: glutamate-5-semialdehyde dehydrogenase [Ruminococcaceae bacterium]|nr:glutamate-5-semialdehyde dehydrogenase [Oscillospiraceae bacterium]